MITIKNLTAQQLLALQQQAAQAGDDLMVRDCDRALIYVRGSRAARGITGEAAARRIVKALRDAAAQ